MQKLLTVCLLLLAPVIAAAERFDMEQYRWQQRPLLIFAPTDKHSGYREMLQAVQTQRTGFVDRDMVLIRVLANSGQADETILSAKEVEHLRQSYAIAPDEFRVLLIGKDGGIKLESGEPVAMDRIFTRIDGMPMRQRESRERRESR